MGHRPRADGRQTDVASSEQVVQSQALTVPSRGRVAAYDDHKGYGFIETRDGRTLFFHCTAIADGTRTIPEDVEVEYLEVTDPRGKPEATDVRPAPRG